MLFRSEIGETSYTSDNNDVIERADIPINDRTVLLIAQDELLIDVMRRELLKYMKVVHQNNISNIEDNISKTEPDIIVIDADIENTNIFKKITFLKILRKGYFFIGEIKYFLHTN